MKNFRRQEPQKFISEKLGHSKKMISLKYNIKEGNQKLNSIKVRIVPESGPRYLTHKQLEAIQKLTLEKGSMLSQVRELFLMQCYTGLRLKEFQMKFSNEQYQLGLAKLLMDANIVTPTIEMRMKLNSNELPFQPYAGLARHTHALHALDCDGIKINFNA